MTAPRYGLPPIFIHEKADFLPLAGEVNWGMMAFAIDRLRTITDGAGIKVGGVDTGCDRKHSLLQNVVDASDHTNSPFGPNDPHGHGTHIMGTILATDRRIGVAPGAIGYHGKGLGDSGSGGDGLLRAEDWCEAQGCVILSESWGGGGLWQEWERNAERRAAKGIWQILAGGNSGGGTQETDYPGRSLHCLNVAALSSDMTPASYSSAGDKIDTSGPGSDIWSCKPGGGFARMSGTSMATPFIAGMLVLYRAALIKLGRRIPTVYELREKLFSRSTDIGPPGDDRRTGPGWLSPMLLSLDLAPDLPLAG